jgi:hypothetical protein
MKHSVFFAIFVCTFGVLRSSPAAQPATAPVTLTPTTQFSAPTPLPYETTGSPITLHLHEALPSDVFAQVGSQANTTIGAWPTTLWDMVRPITVTAEFRETPFWEAMRRLCPKVGIGPMAINEPRVFLSMNASLAIDAPASLHGPVMLVAQTMQRRHTLNFAAPEDESDTCEFVFGLLIEPRLGVVRRSVNPMITDAVDENGRSLIAEPEAEPSMVTDARCCVRVQTALSLPPKAGSRIARLKALVRLGVRSQSRTWEVPLALGQPEQSYDVAGRRMVVGEFEKKGLTYELQWSLSRNGTDADAWARLHDLMAASTAGVRLMDARGSFLTRYNRNTVALPTSDPDLLAFRLTFRKDRRGDMQQAGEPVKLVWEEIQATRDITVPFEFTDLQMP